MGVLSGGIGNRGGGGGGGGGANRDLYWAWRNKLTSKLYPGSGKRYSGGGGGGGGGYGSSSSAAAAPYLTPPYEDPMLAIRAKTALMDPRMASAHEAVGAIYLNQYYKKMSTKHMAQKQYDHPFRVPTAAEWVRKKMF